jgi:hypothetical protein
MGNRTKVCISRKMLQWKKRSQTESELEFNGLGKKMRSTWISLEKEMLAILDIYSIKQQGFNQLCGNVD